ncbi:MAG: hypothetical protein ACTSX4_03835, partial [Candidatus Helarchaeota archaeon]
KFQKGSIEITRDVSSKANVILSTSAQHFMKIIDNKDTIIGSFLKFKMKLSKGFTKLFKVYKIFSNMMN